MTKNKDQLQGIRSALLNLYGDSHPRAPDHPDFVRSHDLVIHQYIVAIPAPGGAAVGSVVKWHGEANPYGYACRDMAPDELALEMILRGIRPLVGSHMIYVYSPSKAFIVSAQGVGPRTQHRALWRELDRLSEQHFIQFFGLAAGPELDQARALAGEAIPLYLDEPE